MGCKEQGNRELCCPGFNPALTSPGGLIVVCQNIPSATSTRGCPPQGGRVVAVGRGRVALGQAWPPVVTTEGGDVRVLPGLSRDPVAQLLWSARGRLQPPLDLSHCLWTL